MNRPLRLVRVLMLLCVLGAPGVAVAGEYSVTTTERQDALLGYLLPRINAQREARRETALTADQLFQQLVRTALGQYFAEYAETTRADACAAYLALPASNQTAIMVQLGGKSPCP